jgi:hypothetical protein
MSSTTAFHGSTNNPTITSNAPPSVAPTSRALDQAVAPLEPVYGRVEHRGQKEGDDEPAYEGAHLPEQEQSAQ